MRAFLLMLGLLAVTAFGASLQAAVIEEYDDFVFLRRSETVRYRVHVDYGSGTSLTMRIYARGLDAAPRVRVRDESRELIANRRAGSSWVLDFDIDALSAEGNIYYIELTHRYGGSRGWIDFNVQLEAPLSQDASGIINFDRYFFERDRGRYYHTCSGSHGGGLPLALIGAAAGVLLLRRRVPVRP